MTIWHFVIRVFAHVLTNSLEKVGVVKQILPFVCFYFLQSRNSTNYALGYRMFFV